MLDIRNNPAMFKPDEDLLKKRASNIKLAQLYEAKNANGDFIVDAGMVWSLKIPIFEHNAYSTLITGRSYQHKMFHKRGRPYLIVSTKEFHNKSQMIFVVPITSSAGTGQDASSFRRGFIVPVEAVLFPNIFIQNLEPMHQSKADCSEFMSVSIDRLDGYMGSVDRDQLNSVKKILADMFSPATPESSDRLYPSRF
jgi:mRNA-degrading endonuclease toxin of MazEF toxin-antitoxin module